MGVSFLRLLGGIQSLFLVLRVDICFNWSSFLGAMLPASVVTVRMISSLRDDKNPRHFTSISSSLGAVRNRTKIGQHLRKQRLCVGDSETIY